MLKKLGILLLICMVLLVVFRMGLAESLFGVVDSSPRKMADSYYSAQGGRIEIKDGSWQFFKNGINSYSCICNFTVVNTTPSIYNIMPAPYLYDQEGRNIFNPCSHLRPLNPFKSGAVVKPGESYEFTGSFDVPLKVALKASVLEIKGGLAEVN